LTLKSEEQAVNHVVKKQKIPHRHCHQQQQQQKQKQVQELEEQMAATKMRRVLKRLHKQKLMLKSMLKMSTLPPWFKS
jgi:hypothetical protein